MNNAEEGDIIVIRFTASWCSPCKVLKLRMSESERIKEYLKQIKAYIVYDIDSETEIILEGLEIKEPTFVPTLLKLVYFNLGWNEVSKLEGLKSEEEVYTWLTKSGI